MLRKLFICSKILRPHGLAYLDIDWIEAVRLWPVAYDQIGAVQGYRDHVYSLAPRRAQDSRKDARLHVARATARAFRKDIEGGNFIYTLYNALDYLASVRRALSVDCNAARHQTREAYKGHPEVLTFGQKRDSKDGYQYRDIQSALMVTDKEMATLKPTLYMLASYSMDLKTEDEADQFGEDVPRQIEDISAPLHRH